LKKKLELMAKQKPVVVAAAPVVEPKPEFIEVPKAVV